MCSQWFFYWLILKFPAVVYIQFWRKLGIKLCSGPANFQTFSVIREYSGTFKYIFKMFPYLRFYFSSVRYVTTQIKYLFEYEKL